MDHYERQDSIANAIHESMAKQQATMLKQHEATICAIVKLGDGFTIAVQASTVTTGVSENRKVSSPLMAVRDRNFVN